MNPLRAAVLALLFAPVLAAQSRPPDIGQSGNPLGRGLFGAPRVRELATAREDALDAMVKDGKLLLSEADVVRLALENNVDINVERYNPYFSLWGVQKGRGVLNPTVAFKTNVDRLVTPSTSLLQGGDTLLNLSALYQLTVHKPFEKGLDLDVDFRTSRLRSSSFFYSLNPSLTSGLSATLTQHLLKDFGSVVRGRFVRIARNDYGMSEEDFVTRASDTLTTALDTYWDVVFNHEDIKVKEASVKLAQVVLEQNRIQAQVGTMAELDVVQAEAEVANRTEALVTARYNKRIAEDQLKKLISSRLDPGVIAAEIQPTSAPAAPPAPVNGVAQTIQRALETRPEVKRQLLDLDNKRIQVGYTRNQLRPQFDLVATYSQNGLGGTRIVRDFTLGFFDAPIKTIEPGGFSDALDTLFSRRFLGYVVGFNFKVTLGNDDARGANAQAQIDYKQGEERLRSLRQKIALEVRDAYDRMERDRARVETAQTSRRYAEKKLQGEQDKYSLGATTTRFILEAQRDLQDAESRLLRASIDLIKSRIAYDKAAGDIFPTYNIELKDALRLFK